jgi:predicted nuclease of restriction endonuclease-like (RecB) superfamily
LKRKQPAILPDATEPTLNELANVVGKMIDEARSTVATTVNASLTLLFWRIGQRVRNDVLQGARAEYGMQVVKTLSNQLVASYGQSFTAKNLQRMIQFAEIFSDEKIVVSLIRQLSWTHFIAIIPIKDPLKRDFYAEMCRLERWSVRTLRNKIDSMLFERTALSRKPEELIRRELDELRNNDRISPDLVFRDPYLLDFLKLHDSYTERDLETAILHEMEGFLLELGDGFSFIGRQKRMVIDGEDHYLDLLFYHRKLKRLIAVELKLGAFKAADKGQMELYLRWLEKYEQEPGENSPLGLILCANGGAESVALLRLDAAGIHVAQYMTELPAKELLQRRLHAMVGMAREQVEARE